MIGAISVDPVRAILLPMHTAIAKYSKVFMDNIRAIACKTVHDCITGMHEHYHDFI